jgi:hypothetical protein
MDRPFGKSQAPKSRCLRQPAEIQPSPLGRGWPAFPMHFIGTRVGEESLASASIAVSHDQGFVDRGFLRTQTNRGWKGTNHDAARGKCQRARCDARR